MQASDLSPHARTLLAESDPKFEARDKKPAGQMPDDKVHASGADARSRRAETPSDAIT